MTATIGRLAPGVLAGAAISVCGATGFVLLHTVDTPALSVLAALIAVGSIGLLAGAWARSARPVRPEGGRWPWRAAAAATALAGVAATLADWSPAPPGGAGSLVVLLLVIGLPSYAIGMLLPTLTPADDHDDEPLAGMDGVRVGLLAGLAVGVFAVEWIVRIGGSPGPLVLAASALLIFPTFAVRGRAAPGERFVAEECTPFAHLRVVELARPGRPPERRMLLDGEEQGGEEVRSGRPTAHYLAALDEWLERRGAEGDAYLFLGGGAYTLPRRVVERDPTASVVVVERDPAVTRMAFGAFSLRPIHRVRTVHADARAWLDSPEAEAPLYRHLVLDVYDGRERLPGPLVTREALARMRRLLTPDGVCVANVIGRMEGTCSTPFWSTIRTVSAVFPVVALYPHFGLDFPDPQNVLVFASGDPLELPERIGAFHRFDAVSWDGAAVIGDLEITDEEEGDREQAES